MPDDSPKGPGTSAPSPVSGTAILMLSIRAKKVTGHYRLTYLTADPSVARSPTWRLTKLDKDGKASDDYDVHQDGHGWHCTCGDFNFRRQNSEKKCKHVEAMRAVGLLRDN